jgi:hypothetical protein
MEQASIEKDAGKNSVMRYLKIKLGVCKRMTKEAAYYKKEAEDNQKIVTQLTLEDADEWQLKQPIMCVEESYTMISESGKRLQVSIDDLYSYLMKVGEDIILSEGEGLTLKQEAEALFSENSF